MVVLKDLPNDVLKKFIIIENSDESGNRLFLIKKFIPFNKRTSFHKRYSSKGIPHKYQQNNTMEECQKSIRKYIINEMGIEPSIENYNNPSNLMTYLKSLKRFFV